MQDIIEKASVLIEALPYIRSFANKTIVVKYGGAAMAAADLQSAVMQDIALMKFCGMKPVVVHGGGAEISAVSQKMGIEPKFIDGFRFTDNETMQIVQMALIGKTNREIVAKLNQQGARSIGLSGHDGYLIKAKKRKHCEVKSGKELDLGFVGEVTAINKQLIETLTESGYVPVIAPVGVDENGQAYNVNADIAAGEIAAALKAEKLVFLTDVEGIRKNKTDAKSVVSHITVAEAKEWIANGQLEGGMIPKLESCFIALQGGTQRVHIIDGRVPHSMLLEIFTNKGIGTMVGTKNENA
jgi:acetylglutamate kinase